MSKKAQDKYFEFHGHEYEFVEERDIEISPTLVRLGRVHSIVYESDKFNGGGDGKKALYEHKFKRGAHLCTNEKGEKILIIVGDKIRVTDRGIVN